VKHHKGRDLIFPTFFFRYIVSVMSSTSIEILHDKVGQGAGFLVNVKTNIQAAYEVIQSYFCSVQVQIPELLAHNSTSTNWLEWHCRN